MKLSNRGFFGSLVTHALVLLLLLLGGLTFPDPPPEEEGILVNFGTDDTGFGQVEPQGDETNQGDPEEEIAVPIPQEVIPTPSQPTVTETAPADNTQDVEETIVKEDPKPSAEEIRQQEAEAQRIRQEQEAERLRKAEEERQERIRQEEEAERQRQQAVADNASNRGRNAFGRQGVGDSEGSEGVNPGSGTNQGTTTGSPGATNYGDGSGLGKGTSYGLGSRKVVGTLPLPNVENCNVTSRIVVTVEIQVDREGNVTSASVESATFADNCIWSVVVAAARKTRFSKDANASFKQTGWIKYTIEP